MQRQHQSAYSNRDKLLCGCIHIDAKILYLRQQLVIATTNQRASSTLRAPSQNTQAGIDPLPVRESSEPSSAQALRLTVVTGVGARRQSRLADEYLQIVILVGVIGSWRIERQCVEGTGVLNTALNLCRQVVVRP